MKSYIFYITIFFLLGCTEAKDYEEIYQIWLLDSELSSDIISFDKNKCELISVKEPFNKLKISIEEFKWRLINDTLYLIDSANNTASYYIYSLNENNLIIGDSSFKNQFRSISCKNDNRPTNQFDKLLLKNSFTIYYMADNYERKLDFVSTEKCISKFDSINFQVDQWSVQKVKNEFFLFMKYPNGSSKSFHLIGGLTDSLLLEYADNGLKKNQLIRNNPKKVQDTKRYLTTNWLESEFSLKRRLVKNRVPPHRNESDIEKISYCFNSDQTYVYKQEEYRKKGKWKLSLSENYILLDSLNEGKDVISIDFINNDSLLITRRNSIGLSEQIGLIPVSD